MPTTVERVLDRQDWLDPVDTGMQQVAQYTLDHQGKAAQKVRDFLHGTWLGHPLHPVLTDLPIGAWTASTVLDLREMLTGDTRLSPGTDAVVGIGLIGAAGAAVTGLNDWQHTQGTARRIGVVHGLLNSGAAACMLTSWLLRRRGNRPAGLALGLVGFGAAFAAAYFGGKLVYDKKVGVDHSPERLRPDHFIAVMAETDLPENEPRRAEIQGTSIVLVRRGGSIYALAETCAHLGGPLAEGSLDGSGIRCPWHGSLFSLETGEVLEGPSVYPQPRFETRIRDGQIEVRAK